MSTNYKVEELMGFAIDVVRSSGAEALSFYGKGLREIKFDSDLVTKADLHLSDFFYNRISSRFPEHRVFKKSEEIKEEYTHDDQRYLWVFDPLDGIANFQAGIPIWGISLALIENFWPIVGVFFMPATGNLFHSYAGGKAFKDDREINLESGEGKVINDESLLLIHSRFHQYYNPSFPGKIRNFGCTTAHICYVAMGRAEGAIVANESFQDLAAGQIIIESAGGKIVKMDGSDFYLGDYQNGQKINEHLIACSPDLCESIRNSITPAG